MQSSVKGLKWGVLSGFDWLTASVGEVRSPPPHLSFASVPQEVILYVMYVSSSSTHTGGTPLPAAGGGRGVSKAGGGQPSRGVWHYIVM